MSEMSDMHKLIMAMKLAKTAQVGMELTYFDVIELLGELDSLKSCITELEAERRWIPVSERLPEEDKLVLFYDYFTEEIRKGWLSNNQWTSDESIYYNCDRFNRITHWKPLPQLPEVQE